MKRIFILLILLIYNYLFFIVNAQSIYFNKRIDIANGDWDISTTLIAFGNGYLVGGDCGTGRKIFLSKLDSVGNIEWTKIYSETGYNYFLGLSGSLFQTMDKYLAICGGRVPQPKGYGILLKVDSIGNKKWEKEYLLSDVNNNFNSGNITKDSGYILTGYANYSSPRQSYLLLKTDNLGNQQWYKTYTDNHPNRNYAGKSVIQTPDNGYCIGGGGGYWYDPGIKYRSINEIIKTDSLGNQQWKKTYGDGTKCNLEAKVCLSKDSCIVSAFTLGFSDIPEENSQAYLTKLSLNGNEKWYKKIGNAEPNNWVSWIQNLNDGSFIISGSHYLRDTLGKYVGWLFKINCSGDSSWYREYTVINGVFDVNQLWQVKSTPDKGFAAAGSLFPNSAGGTQDIWVFKTDSLGCLVPNCTGILVTEFNKKAGAQMLIYPNPFTSAFAINYNIPKESKKGVFELRDVFGSLVYSTPLSNNVNQLQVVAGALKPGVYIAGFIIDGALVKTEKLIRN